MFDIVSIVTIAGYAGVSAIIFAECGLFLGFFLPGDSLLFTAGFLAAQGKISFLALICFTTIAGILGETVGYAIGKKLGPKIFNRKRSRLFDPEHVQRAHEFFLHHGNKAIVLARFLPVIRTFVPSIAGVARMPYRSFMIYNIIGGCAWIWSMTILGFTLGKQLDHAEKYLYPIILAIIILSFLPTLFEWHKAKKRRNAGTH